MHPISKTNFGPAGIAVVFNNGTALVNGYILKQLGTSKFSVTDGNVVQTAVLATDTVDAQSLPAGMMTIVINGNEFVARLYSKRAVTVAGIEYEWSLDTAFDGSKVIQSYNAVAQMIASGGTLVV